MVKTNKRETKDRLEGAGKRRQFIIGRLTAVACIILIILSPWLMYLYDYQYTTAPSVDLAVEQHTREVVSRLRNSVIAQALELIRTDPVYNTNVTKFQDDLNTQIEQTLAAGYQPYSIPEHDLELMVSSFTVTVRPSFAATADLVRYPQVSASTSAEDQDRLGVDMIGRYHDVTVPYSYHLLGEIKVLARQLKSEKGDDAPAPAARTVAFNEVLPIPHLFVEHKLQQIQNQAETMYSDLGRMMGYMLTTVARMRCYTRTEFSAGSHKNIINEGDVELALNLALLLEEALLFRVYDKDAASAVDQYYYYASEADQRDNPTGKRQWGNSELSNYYDYLSRKAYMNDPAERLLSNLLDKYVNHGYIDPADILGLYLILDKGHRSAVIDSPKDNSAILENRYDTRYLLDPRTPNDAGDTTDLKFVPELLSTEHDQGFDMIPIENMVDTSAWAYSNLELAVDQEPNYLIQGADFKVTGLDRPRGWMTTAELRSGTRTPSVVPEKPEDHDYRLEWDLDIEGEFSIGLRPGQFSSLSQTQVGSNGYAWNTKVINFKSPVNIFVWFSGDPKIGSVEFIDFNSGGATDEGWIITSESTLVEYFQKSLWPYLKPMMALGFDELFAMNPLVLAGNALEQYYHDENRRLSTLMAGHCPGASNWITDILLFQARGLKRILAQDQYELVYRIGIFMEFYLLDYLDQYDEEYGLFNITTGPQFPFPPLIPWISALGFDVTLQYNQDTDVINITLVHSNGYISLLVTGYGTTYEQQLGFIIKSGFELPDIIKLTTTVTSSGTGTGGDESQPGIFADGVLYNKYVISTRAYPKPTPYSTDGNEQFLFTRANFGKLLHAGEIQLHKLDLGPQLDKQDTADLSLAITLFIPRGNGGREQEQLDQASELNELMSSLDAQVARQPIMNEQDRFIQDRIYVSQALRKLSDDLLAWHTAPSSRDVQTRKIAVDIALSSKGARDQTNLTIFLTEPESARHFISWLGARGLELVQALRKPGTTLTDLALVLTRSSSGTQLEVDDIVDLDLELYNRVLDHELQTGMNIDKNIQNLYQLHDYGSGSNAGNLTLVLAFSGAAVAAAADGLIYAVEEQGPTAESAMETYSQAYYCLPSVGDDGDNALNILLGTTWFHRV